MKPESSSIQGRSRSSTCVSHLIRGGSYSGRGADSTRQGNGQSGSVNYDNVVFVCEAAARSAVAAEFAASLGKQNLYNLEGGTGAWRKQGLPIDK